MDEIIRFTVNGEAAAVRARPEWSLLRLLRDEVGLTGAKEGCGAGECGACTVLVDGAAVNSCLFPALEAEGKEVVTIEGLAGPGGKPHPLQEAFVRHGAVQCGFCTPGMVLSAKALLDRVPEPSEEEVRTALAGNLCRCTGYNQILEAVGAASRQLRGEEGSHV
ncbi:MAG: (2Fe-2S)-binding protein [Deferrisomatales bacterium]|nr:(2Fe-2S)-binding protein [Deferrisomatales bacterium]